MNTNKSNTSTNYALVVWVYPASGRPDRWDVLNVEDADQIADRDDNARIHWDFASEEDAWEFADEIIGDDSRGYTQWASPLCPSTKQQRKAWAGGFVRLSSWTKLVRVNWGLYLLVKTEHDTWLGRSFGSTGYGETAVCVEEVDLKSLLEALNQL